MFEPRLILAVQILMAGFKFLNGHGRQRFAGTHATTQKLFQSLNFANANGIYNTNMGSNIRGGITYTSGTKYTIRTSMGDKPVNYVSWDDAARFTNWLNNGQGAGSTETGAYTLSGNTGITTRTGGSGGTTPGVTVWLPSEDEWYKAAYCDPTPGVSVANYNFGADWNAQNGNVTTVGSAAANNYLGTADQGGNVWEWNDAVISGSSRGLRGDSWGRRRCKAFAGRTCHGLPRYVDRNRLR